MPRDYADVLASKIKAVQYAGFDVTPEQVNPKLYLFQRDIARWACKLSKAAIFAECGLGKTPMQLEWARLVSEHTQGKVLILAPLAVAPQTVREAAKFGITVQHVREHSQIVGDSGVFITNYEALDKFRADDFSGVVLDESSILKNFMGARKREIIEMFARTPFKLACTATPAPNDYLELGNHADFLNVMASNEMISRWFINNTMEAGDYRLKKHAEGDFWRWITSWAVCIRNPSDLGAEYDMPGYKLPALRMIEQSVEISEKSMERARSKGMLLPDSAPSSTDLHAVKRDTLEQRLDKAIEIITALDGNEPFIVWCDTNDESTQITRRVEILGIDVTEVEGSQNPDEKARRLLSFADGNVRAIVTKSSIAGLGMNWQHAAHNIYLGLNHSFEKLYQSLRRTYRFGQTREVIAHLIYSYTEGDVLHTISEKESAFEEMQRNMTNAMQEHGLFRDNNRLTLAGIPSGLKQGTNWTMHLGDCVTTMQTMPESQIDFSVFSPPFAELYIYSDSVADMGNSANYEEFFEQYDFCAKELLRITRPGRLCAVHCKDLPLYFNRDGAAGLRDFPGDLIKSHERAGWTFHSRVTIWKDPVIEMQRTKNHGLLHKNFTERAEATRQGMADYMLIFRKHPIEGGVNVVQNRQIGDYIGTNPPTDGEIYYGRRSEQSSYSIAVWQRYASPVWWDIDQTDVLNYQQARAAEDEKHICPLQLGVIRRSIDIWTNKGDTVFSPFAGIGSEGYVALEMGRKFIGVELKPEYHAVASRFLTEAESKAKQPSLFDLFDDTEQVG